MFKLDFPESEIWESVKSKILRDVQRFDFFNFLPQQLYRGIGFVQHLDHGHSVAKYMSRYSTSMLVVIEINTHVPDGWMAGWPPG